MFRRLFAPLGTIALLAGAVTALLWASGPPLTALRSGTATFDEALGGVAAIGAWLLLGWIVLVLLGTALAALPGAAGRASSRITGAITPVAARRTARLALGVAVAAGPVALSAGPAMAHGPGAAPSVAADLVADASDLPVIERPTRPDQTPRPAAPLSVASLTDDPQPETAEPATPEPVPEPATAPSPTPVIVQSGDSLWAIAARHLGSGATDTEIAAEWPRWYEANREVIGDDPDLIMPGVTLTPPTAP